MPVSLFSTTGALTVWLPDVSVRRARFAPEALSVSVCVPSTVYWFALSKRSSPATIGVSTVTVRACVIALPNDATASTEFGITAFVQFAALLQIPLVSFFQLGVAVDASDEYARA